MCTGTACTAGSNPALSAKPGAGPRLPRPGSSLTTHSPPSVGRGQRLLHRLLQRAHEHGHRLRAEHPGGTPVARPTRDLHDSVRHPRETVATRDPCRFAVITPV